MFRITALAVMLSAFAVRAGLLFRSLQYDELWSWQFFSQLELKEILFSLSLPNNHPLNTLAIKLAGVFTQDIFAIRYFPLLCGMLLIPVVYFVMEVWSKDRLTASLAAVFTAFSAPFITYSALARGYIPQAFFFALTAAGFACFDSRYAKKWSKVGFVLILLGGTGTVLSVPTGIVFISGLVLAIAARYRTKPPKLMLGAIISGGVIAAIYYLAVYAQLSSAQKWSVGGNYFIQCGKILFTTGCFGYLCLAGVGVLVLPKNTTPLLLIPFTVLLSGAVTGLGPERTYIIFSGVFACMSAIAISTLFQFKFPKATDRTLQVTASIILTISAIALQAVYLPQWRLPEWKLDNVKTPSSTLCVYPANSGYPLLWNNGSEFLTAYQISTANLYIDTLRMYAENGIINGMDQSQGEKSIQTSLSGRASKDNVLGIYHEYQLEPYTGTAPEKSCYLVIHPLQQMKNPPPANALRLNPWFENAPDGKGCCAVYFTETPPASLMGRNIYIIKSLK